jgi:hypothetical protein
VQRRSTWASACGAGGTKNRYLEWHWEGLILGALFCKGAVALICGVDVLIRRKVWANHTTFWYSESPV